jgi:hypothetical protein
MGIWGISLWLKNNKIIEIKNEGRFKGKLEEKPIL